MKIAVFDLGTNVFNLLISNVSKNSCNIVKVIKCGAHIGEGGFKNGALTQEALNSSMTAIGSLYKEIEQQGDVEYIKAFATSAIRDSSNGPLFTSRVKDKYNIDVEIISGEREAQLIYKGVRESMLLYNDTVLILDVGGGSNELIIADKDQIFWKQSYPLGVIRMKELIAPSDPIKTTEVESYLNHLERVLENFYEQILIYKPKLLIGTSGSFDTIRELLYPDDNFEVPARQLEISEFGELHKKLLKSTREERFAMAGMSPLRAEYMVLGSIFVDHIIKNSGIDELYQSSYSLKEGYMAEFAEQLYSDN